MIISQVRKRVDGYHFVCVPKDSGIEKDDYVQLIKIKSVVAPTDQSESTTPAQVNEHGN